MPIHVLPPEVAAKIAAGEVVERPASVVKELVENSLDAGATEITVEVRGGGLELIRVSDNGSGIPAAEVPLAFQRHATSKLSSADDLSTIATLGFRGEALPSIAAVAHVTMLTRAPQEQSGTYAEVEGEKALRREPRGAPQGATVTVRCLFENVPARLKFMRSRASESARVQQVVHHSMLAYPEVRFTLLQEDRPPQVSGGTGRLRDVLATVYGPEAAGAMLEIPSSQEGPIAVTGLVSPPNLTRSNRNAITLLVNRRWVQSRLLTYAVEEAYRGFLQEGRHPLAVIDIAVPYDEVDVNVHPAKSEVRFHEESRVFAALQRAVREALTSTSPVPAVGVRSLLHARAPVPPTERAPGLSLPAPSAPELQPFLATSPEHRETPTPRERLPVLRVLGQLQETYVVAEGPDGMYLVDQHAAHERVTYERLREQIASGESLVQGLLEPAIVEVPPDLVKALHRHLGLLERYGFRLEPFGSGSYLIRGVPLPLSGASPGDSLTQLLEALDWGKEASALEEEVVVTLACHGSVRAGKRLALEEMQALLRQLETCSQPQTCPHGRPTMVHVSATRLEREFGRR
ncbi:MAG: DNA mismatch repair endonuclease MutL [Dehalococcoidia bacterium]|nr:DNA mismatch repair endonuclease MutL [Dehalococcoidia bacterium]